MNGHAVAGKTPAIKQLLLSIHVVKNFNLEISRCHLAEKAGLTRQRELTCTACSVQITKYA